MHITPYHQSPIQSGKDIVEDFSFRTVSQALMYYFMIHMTS